MSFTLLSPITGTAPFTLGFAFVKGHIQANQGVASNIAEMQVVPKNYWSDGSLKYAILSGHVELTADTPLVVTMGPSGNVNNAALTLSDLKATGVTSTINCGAFGSMSWQNNDWDTPHSTWIEGWQLSSWIYRKPVGTDPHLVVWLEVRLYKGNAVEVLPWIENGYIRVPNPTSKAETFEFQLGGESLFSKYIDIPTHTRTPLLFGTALSYWFGIEDPAVTVRHDALYMQASLLVPSYFANVSPVSGTAQRLARSFSPLQQSNFDYDSDSMASPGYQRPIGLLPEHDVMYLVCNNASIVYNAVVFNGYSAGRYPLHYRDENTLNPLRFTDYPNLVIHDTCRFKDNGSSTKYDVTPACSGTPSPGWDTAHLPSVGYMAYLVTGRRYFMEQVQFAATTNFLGLTDGAIRNFSSGLLHPTIGAFQTRSSAWTIRSLVQAITVTPDSDDYRNNFVTSWEKNIQYHHSLYNQQPNNNFGLIQPGEAYSIGSNPSGTNNVAIWQQDFVTAAWGYAITLDPPISEADSQKIKEFFQWKAKAIVDRLGPSNRFWYINAAPYTITVSTAAVPNYLTGAGPWLSDWSAIYSATFATPPSWMGNTEGVLAAEYDLGSWGRSFWGNLQPAISYSVQLGVAGAVESYFRMINATNWPELKATFDYAPVWSVTPASTSKYENHKDPFNVLTTNAEIVEVPSPVAAAPYTPSTSGSPSKSPSRTPVSVNSAMPTFASHAILTFASYLSLIFL
jgi:hypothetical protein